MGYQNLETPDGGKKMICPTFLNISESNKVSLADLKVTGYDPPEKSSKGSWSKGCPGGKFILEKLTTSGTHEVSYYWIDFGVNKGDRIGPGWFADDVGTPIVGGADSVKFDSSTGFWTQGNNLSLVPAGAVNTFDVSYKTSDGGKVAIGNPTPIALTLADLTVTGYDPPEKSSKGSWSKGCPGGKFILEKLTTSGTHDISYYWIDFGVNKGDRIGPGWFADDTGTPIDGGASSITIPAGQAYWTQGNGLTIIFPAPELDAESGK